MAFSDIVNGITALNLTGWIALGALVGAVGMLWKRFRPR